MNSPLVPQIVNSGLVLTSWKDIAHYMGKGVRTVQRWEQDFGLPVRRPCGSSKKAILARPRDLDAWVALRCSSRSQGPSADGADNHHEARTAFLTALASLEAGIEAHRALRSENRLLLGEVKAAVHNLRTQLGLIRRP